ncbi:hypothetical protein [Delftia deserti]|uniref:Transmembrane protein n=1 Tax=Delftia deserti TaxID=1651218 RepID=A0ABW5EQI1_9BURK
MDAWEKSVNYFFAVLMVIMLAVPFFGAVVAIGMFFSGLSDAYKQRESSLLPTAVVGPIGYFLVIILGMYYFKHKEIIIGLMAIYSCIWVFFWVAARKKLLKIRGR